MGRLGLSRESSWIALGCLHSSGCSGEVAVGMIVERKDVEHPEMLEERESTAFDAIQEGALHHQSRKSEPSC